MFLLFHCHHSPVPQIQITTKAQSRVGNGNTPIYLCKPIPKAKYSAVHNAGLLMFFPFSIPYCGNFRAISHDALIPLFEKKIVHMCVKNVPPFRH